MSVSCSFKVETGKMARCMNRRIERKKRPFPTKIIILSSSILLIGFWLRLWNVDTNSFWSDEGLTPLRSGYSILEILRNVIIIQGKVTKDTHPALFYLLIHFSRQLFGETDFAFRLPVHLNKYDVDRFALSIWQASNFT